MLNIVRADLARYLDGSPPSLRRVLKVLKADYGLQVTIVYRFGRVLKGWIRRPVLFPLAAVGFLLYFPLYWIGSRAYGIRLYLSADIGPALYIGHFGGIEIANCRVGACCTIGEQVRIGARDVTTGPDIEDRVWIGGHVRVIGAIKIGRGATIASGALVDKDVPSRALLVGRPGRILSRDYDNTRILGAGVFF
jgi:serine O-acetyltransferase